MKNQKTATTSSQVKPRLCMAQADSIPRAGTAVDACATRLRGMSEKQREYAGVAVQPVVRNLAVAEEPHYRHFTEPIADDAQLFRAFAEQARTASQAGKINRAFGFAIKAAADALEHAIEIVTGTAA